MGPAKLLQIAWHEATSTSKRTRVPEPDLVMESTDQVSAFTKGGKTGGALLPLYQTHLERLARVLAPGDRILDLGCGSGELLCRAAQIFSKCHFVGVDLSEEMLLASQSEIQRLGLRNVELTQDDISRLSQFKENSFNVVTSSLAFHHLPDAAALCSSFAQINRVVVEGGGIYIFDLGPIKSETSVKLLVLDQRATQPPQLVDDYDKSLRAAFDLEDWQMALKELSKVQCKFTTLPLIHFLVQVTSKRVGEYPGSRDQLNLMRTELNSEQLREYLILKLAR